MRDGPACSSTRAQPNLQSLEQLALVLAVVGVLRVFQVGPVAFGGHLASLVSPRKSVNGGTRLDGSLATLSRPCKCSGGMRRRTRFVTPGAFAASSLR